MKKRIFSICLVALAIASIFCGCNAKSNKQIAEIANNKDTWYMQTEEGTTIYGYAVTDLDDNGRLEIIASMNYGIGSTTESRYYELSEDKKTMVECEHSFDGDSQADIMIESADCYKDKDGKLYYVYTDISGKGFREAYETEVAVCLYEGKVTEERIATKSTIYEGDSEVPVITFTDASGNTITEEQFENCVQERFADAKEMDASFGWKGYSYSNHSNLISEGDEQFKAILMDSYSKFSVE